MYDRLPFVNKYKATPLVNKPIQDLLMSLVKDIYSPEFFDHFSELLQEVLPDFAKETFLQRIFTPAFADMAWKERMQHTSHVLHEFLPENFEMAAPYLLTIVEKLLKQRPSGDSLVYIFLPEYIATYGLSDFPTSVALFERTTQLISAEFAVRPFLLTYPEAMIQQMSRWSQHPSSQVRRLASEGSRPRLPWGIGIPALKKDPSPTLPILENLKNDPSESVRRSVANHLNDIAKDHPEVVMEIARQWAGQSAQTDALIKHACRTLLKRGYPEALAHYGLESEDLTLTDVQLLTKEVRMGESLTFSFVLTNQKTRSHTVRLEYGIYFRKANGQLSRKVFKISERLYPASESSTVIRRHAFRPITTRVYYAGEHQLSIIVNGEEKCTLPFTLFL
ncbi:DNA alkylation repair protein [Siphonobacter sp.]|uniref:DNA alkylation repair protein n=1 Tax=Siphonobacter sp. TaxID=1869184 RepID=UPI003B3BD26B